MYTLKRTCFEKLVKLGLNALCHLARSKVIYDSLYTQVFWSSTATWIVAFINWVTDMTFCLFALKLGIPIFHAVWHVLCSVAICASLNLLIFVDLFSNNKLKNSSIKLKRYPEFFGFFAYQYLDIQIDWISWLKTNRNFYLYLCFFHQIVLIFLIMLVYYVILSDSSLSQSNSFILSPAAVTSTVVLDNATWHTYCTWTWEC